MIKVGCCGFPVKRETYDKVFSVVEVQQTFYQLPQLTTANKWREEAHPDFEFTMKAWQLITHEPSSPTYRRLRTPVSEKMKKECGSFKNTESVARAWSETAEFARALGAKKIVFQCPASYGPSEENIDRLQGFFKRIERDAFTFVWEPRGHWERKEVERICRELDIVPCLDPLTDPPGASPLLYVRLHGRTGYRYTYSDRDLMEMVKIAKQYTESYLMFNNISMYGDALRLKSLLA